MTKTDRVNNDLSGKVAIVTGGSRGIGQAIAHSLVKSGASVAICARSEKDLATAAGQLSEQVKGREQKIFHRVVNVASQEECQNFVRTVEQRLGAVDILVNNAGVYGPMGATEDVDLNSWQEALQINLMGSLHMATAVIRKMKERRYGKIIQLSGGGATAPLPGISAYAASKAAVVRLMETLAEEVREFGIDVNCVAPGALNTKMLEEVLRAGEAKVGPKFYARALKQNEEGGTPLEVGASLVNFLASSQSDGLTGKLISAVWDPWQTLPEHRDELKSSDVYTLRRIVPKDRGLDW
jgi:NAD(P)-dependent dehydrogenase (short-subunit alcohol dehydrogenase family)